MRRNERRTLARRVACRRWCQKNRGCHAHALPALSSACLSAWCSFTPLATSSGIRGGRARLLGLVFAVFGTERHSRRRTSCAKTVSDRGHPRLPAPRHDVRPEEPPRAFSVADAGLEMRRHRRERVALECPRQSCMIERHGLAGTAACLLRGVSPSASDVADDLVLAEQRMTTKESSDDCMVSVVRWSAVSSQDDVSAVRLELV